MRTPEQVIAELQRRARKGFPLNSGYNRGDWLYAGAVKSFGSWGKAVKAAGFDYEAIKIRPLTAREAIEQIQALAAARKCLRAGDHGKLWHAAIRHFGSWKKALAKAGCNDVHLLWTKERVIERIRTRQAKGQPVNSAQIMDLDRYLYAAGRRRFGSWAAALEAAADGKARSE
jgi:hypothetical protein